MGNIKIPATRATAIAVANAVVIHLKLGLFISEFRKIETWGHHDSELVGNTSFSIEGRSNSTEYLLITGMVIPKRVPNGQFPVEKVLVTYHGPYQGQMTSFECVFGTDRIEFSTIEPKPYVG